MLLQRTGKSKNKFVGGLGLDVLGIEVAMLKKQSVKLFACAFLCFLGVLPFLELDALANEMNVPYFVSTRIEFPFEKVVVHAASFISADKNNAGKIFLMPLKNFFSADLKQGKVAAFQDKLEKMGEKKYLRSFWGKINELKEDFISNDLQIAFLPRDINPEIYKDTEGLHLDVFLDWGNLEHEPESQDLVLRVALKTELDKDWSLKLIPSGVVEWNGKKLTSEAFKETTQRYVHSIEVLLNEQLNLKTLKQYLSFDNESNSDCGSNDQDKNALKVGVLEKWIKELWEDLLLSMPEAYKIEYLTQDAQGKDITVSGVIVFPLVPPSDMSQVPILSIQHPTLLERRFSPSEILAGLQNPVESQFFAYIALLAAAKDYLVVASDYPGLGISKEPHPFCHSSLSSSVVDAIRVAKVVLEEKGNLKPNGWNGDVYLIGYSEGGYASMVAARDIQQNYSKEISLAGVAALSGPYSLSNTMRREMTTPKKDYKTPYLLPMLLHAYNTMYPDSGFALETAIAQVLTDIPDYTDKLQEMLGGEHGPHEINALLMAKKDYSQMGPVAVLSPEFLSLLEDTKSKTVMALAENDAYRNWVPQIPMKLIHHSKDETVPVGNTMEAYQAFGGENSEFVEMELFDGVFSVTGTVHEDASAASFLKGILWLISLKNPNH